jgi:hypothetical protein
VLVTALSLLSHCFFADDESDFDFDEDDWDFMETAISELEEAGRTRCCDAPSLTLLSVAGCLTLMSLSMSHIAVCHLLSQTRSLTLLSASHPVNALL